MTNPIDLIVRALDYYDNNKEVFANFFEKVRYYKVDLSRSELESDMITFYDKNKDIMLETRFEFLGTYNNSSKTWLWAWSNPVYNKNRTITSRHILNYGFNIKPESQSQFLKTELITSRFRIFDQVQLDIHIAIGAYISKSALIYNLHEYLDISAGDDEGLTKIVDSNKDNYILYSLILLDHNKMVIH